MMGRGVSLSQLARLALWPVLLGGILASPVWAQDSTAPRLEVDFASTQTVPGQPLTLRLTVLVPTFLPVPPDWPDFDSPNVMVRLPERASAPTSRVIDGTTWAGVSRRYQLTPMAPGVFDIPASELRLSYRSPEGDEVLTRSLPVPALQLTGRVPEGAEGLSPFIAAQSLSLHQSIEGPTTGLQPGDSFTRSLQIEVEGLSPIFLPPLLTDDGMTGLRSYPATPTLEEVDNRGRLSGSRREQVTYVAEGAVEAALPALQLRWFNLATGQIETATADPIPVTAQAPVPPAAKGPGLTDLWPVAVRMAAWMLAITAAGLIIRALLRRITPPVAEVLRRRRHRQRASARYAHQRLCRAARRRDLGAVLQAYYLWRDRLPPNSRAADPRIQDTFLALGAARFGRTGRAAAKSPDTAEIQLWLRLQALLCVAGRQDRLPKLTGRGRLPALNPVARKT